MRQYEKYKAVETLWNLNFPTHWNVFPLCSMTKEKSICNCTDMELLSVYLDAGVVPFSKRTEKRTNTTSKDLSKYQRVDVGDFVLNNQQAWRGSVGVSKYTGITSPAYIILSLNDQLILDYANYLFRSRIMVDQYLIASKGVGSIQRNLYWQELKRASVLVPPKDEQDQIVRFLDWKVSHINRLIHGYQRQIKLLEEYKKSQITHLVTHGIEKHEMIDSEIYWLKSVPKDWRVTRLKHILKKQQRPIPENAELLICSNSGEVKIRGESKMGLVAESDDIYQGVKQGDLLIHGMDTWHGAIAVSDFDGMCTPVVHVCTSKESVRFVAYYLKMMAYTKVFKAISNGVRQNTSDFRSWDKAGALYIALPSLEEQEMISDKIDDAILKINNSISVINREIDALKEYRTRLISDVVTGQVDVRGVEIPDYTPEEDNAMDEEINDTEEVTDSAD